jgi:PAS domain S-box-containing protein
MSTRRPDEGELYAAFLQHVRDIILVIDVATGQIVAANRAAELAYQYSLDELCALSIHDLRIDPPAEVANQMKTADSSGILFEAMHRRRDGSTFPVEIGSKGQTIGEQRLLFSIIRDITERKRFEAERERLLEATQVALAIREDFLWVAAHELRTPLAVMSLQLQQLRRLMERDEPHERLRVELGAALRQVDRLDLLIDGLLDATQGDRIELAIEDVDLAELVHEIAARFGDARTPLHVAVEPLAGRWDRARLGRAFASLITNAVKYGAGRPVRVTSSVDGEDVCIAVADEGIGISAEDLERVFDKFERAVPSAHYGGLGLGLYVARQIVEAHGGRIDVDSSPGSGATFRVTLPRRCD